MQAESTSIRLLVLTLVWAMPCIAGPAEGLFDAAKRGDAATVLADVNAKNDDGEAALEWASTHGHIAGGAGATRQGG